MNPKLSPLMLDVLRAIDAGEGRPKSKETTVKALWSRGLITWSNRIGMNNYGGWVLTKEGKLAVKKGRQMISQRKP
jgi:hypothetical protein